MYEIPPSETLTSLLSTFKSWGGGAFDYALMGWNDNVSIHPYELHKDAAIFTAQTVTDRHMQFLRERFLEDVARSKRIWPWMTEENGYRIDERKGTQIRPNEAKGYQISLEDFFAPARMWIRRDDVHKHPSLWNVEDFLDFLDRTHQEGCYIKPRSYLHAFSDPPYPLRRSQVEIEELFHEINQQLFGVNLDTLTVYKWSTDWIDFMCFDEGYDWWGSYLWTVFNTQTSTIIGIAASATD